MYDLPVIRAVWGSSLYGRLSDNIISLFVYYLKRFSIPSIQTQANTILFDRRTHATPHRTSNKHPQLSCTRNEYTRLELFHFTRYVWSHRLRPAHDNWCGHPS